MKRTLRIVFTVIGLALGILAGLAWHARAQAGRNVDLVFAAMQESPQAVRDCLDAGASPAATEEGGFTSLHFAAIRGNEEIARMLLDRGADPSARSLNGGFTPLHVAARNGSTKVIRLLLDRGAARAVRSDDGTTPAQVAHRCHHHEAERLLEGDH